MAAASLLLLAAAALLISPALSQNCTSLTIRNRTFKNCSDLQYLNATLHWTYNASALTLSIAFTAAAKANEWIAWGLNPTGSGMLGTQALVAFAAENKSLVVNTYNISSYNSISESRIEYDVSGKSVMRLEGKTTIFATLLLPSATTVFNHTWQMGQMGPVANWAPQKHAMLPDNMASKGMLTLLGGAADTPAGSPAAGPSGTVSPTEGSPGAGGGSPNGNQTGGGARVWGSGFGLYGVLVVLWVSNFGF